MVVWYINIVKGKTNMTNRDRINSLKKEIKRLEEEENAKYFTPAEEELLMRINYLTVEFMQEKDNDLAVLGNKINKYKNELVTCYDNDFSNFLYTDFDLFIFEVNKKNKE